MKITFLSSLQVSVSLRCLEKWAPGACWLAGKRRYSGGSTHFMSETRLARQESLISREAAATFHDSCRLVSDKRGSATALSPSGPVSKPAVWFLIKCQKSLLPSEVGRNAQQQGVG